MDPDIFLNMTDLKEYGIVRNNAMIELIAMNDWDAFTWQSCRMSVQLARLFSKI